MNARFALGQIVATPGAIEVLEESKTRPLTLLDRHVSGDWGDLWAEDKQENEFAVSRSLRILSAYKVGKAKVWVITEADRSSTTILLPSEY